MKKMIVLGLFLCSLAQAASIYKSVPDATSSGEGEGSMLTDAQRPAGFIIKHVSDEMPQNLSVDDDGDGVVNENDKCPDTPAGKVVDNAGCMKLIRLNVRFDFDKYNLKEEYRDEIEQAVLFLRENKQLGVSIEGHTDAIGSNQYNQTLSEKRAHKIANILEQAHIASDRMQTKGFGEMVPVAPNDTAEGRAQNRRVDITFNKEK